MRHFLHVDDVITYLNRDHLEKNDNLIVMKGWEKNLNVQLNIVVK